MPLRQPHPCLISYQIAVIKIRHRQPQRPKQQNLPRRGLQQIRPAHNFRNFHRRIIHHNRQLIGRNIIPPPNNKISKIAPCDQPLRPQMQIRKTNLLAIRHAKPPVRTWNGGRLVRPARAKPSGPRQGTRPALPRIHRLIIPLIRRRSRLRYILPRTGARINKSRLAQSPPRLQIMPAPLALRVRPKRPSAIRPLAPLDPQPAQVVEHGGQRIPPGTAADPNPHSAESIARRC